MEMFLLFGENYVKDGTLGKACHKKRVAFEANLRQTRPDLLREFYKALANLGLGRQIVAFAQAS